MRRPQPALRAVAQRAYQRLDEEAGDRPGQPQHRQLRLVRAKIGIDRPHVALLQAEAELQAQEPQVHFEDARQRQAWTKGFHGILPRRSGRHRNRLVSHLVAKDNNRLQ